ncbi:MAG TPA: hypothetical protein VG733_01025 [Chthoniobacteraceae bacterium]|nr:hypothetical protein [Chthoniobacteraceae bacterium]
MKRIFFFFAAFLILVPAPQLFAESVVEDVPPAKPDSGGFHFDVTAKAGANGTIDFQVVITPIVTRKGKHADFVQPSTVLGVAKINPNTETISTLQQLAQQSDGKSITCVFTVQEKSLEDPDYCFIFTNYVERVVNGKVEMMPSSDIYLVRLKNFYKKQQPGAAAAGAH